MSRYEDWKNLAAAAQGFAVAAAVVVGGVWTGFQFQVFDQKEKSDANLRAIDRARLVADFDYQPLSDIDGDRMLVEVAVTLRNHGSAATILSWGDDGPLKVSAVDLERDTLRSKGAGTKSYRSYMAGGTNKPFDEQGEIRVDQGDMDRLVFLVPMSRSTTYLITFRADPDEKINRQSIEDGVDPSSGPPPFWAFNDFTRIEGARSEPGVQTARSD